ncbi:MAG TPA: hypothetical protein VGB90_06095, partial [Alphaproteobacteria bacterium]
YKVEWGDPMSASRLKRMAYAIASFVWQQRGRSAPSYQAMEKWRSDLNYLKRTYYDDFSKKFKWPSL